jgi:hypothetical protein
LVAEPRVEIHAGGGHPNMRVLTYRGVEIHRCEMRAVPRPEILDMQ